MVPQTSINVGKSAGIFAHSAITLALSAPSAGSRASTRNQWCEVTTQSRCSPAAAGLDRAQRAAVVQIDAIGFVEVVADEQVGPAISIQIRKQQSQRVALRPRQRLRLEAAASLVAPETIDRGRRIEEARLRGAG